MAGSDAGLPVSWPQGSVFVLLDGNLPQINLPLASRGLDRYYRIGASEHGYTDINATTHIVAFSGIGLRPYSVSHLEFQRDLIGNLQVKWIRRTRIDGDSWQSVEVPLGEAVESYTVKVIKNNFVVRQLDVPESSWNYSAAMQTVDEVEAPFEVHVAQNSIGFGPGPFKSVLIL